MTNIAEVISVITKGMSEKDIELMDIKLYKEAVELNKKVKVCIGMTGRGNEVWFLVRRVDTKECIQFQLYSIDSMLDKVLELLTAVEWLPGDNIEAYGDWFTLVVEESSYLAEKKQYQYYRLLDKNYSLSDRKTLEDLKSSYTNVSLEQDRLK